jgi:hypothetical protein
MTNIPTVKTGSAAGEDFPTVFAHLKLTVIDPAFETVATQLKQSGHEINIANETNGDISIHIVPAGTKKSIHPYGWFPTLTFFAMPATKTIGLQGRNARRNAEGSPGTRGEFRPAQINDELVNKEVLKFVGEIANW